jgi:hypothetical protein
MTDYGPEPDEDRLKFEQARLKAKLVTYAHHVHTAEGLASMTITAQPVFLDVLEFVIIFRISKMNIEMVLRWSTSGKVFKVWNDRSIPNRPEMVAGIESIVTAHFADLPETTGFIEKHKQAVEDLEFIKLQLKQIEHIMAWPELLSRRVTAAADILAELRKAWDSD